MTLKKVKSAKSRIRKKLGPTHSFNYPEKHIKKLWKFYSVEIKKDGCFYCFYSIKYIPYHIINESK